MRKQSLRQTANRYLKMDNRGSFKDKKHRAFVIHKMIDDLFVVGDVPTSWRTLKSLHIQKLIQHWQKDKTKANTIMGYMTVIRRFLNNIDCQLADIDNQSLGLIRNYTRHKKTDIQSDIWLTISEPVVQFIMALQTQFGLTLSEAIRFVPDINWREHHLWITREIAFNSEDRMIALRSEVQRNILNELSEYTQGYLSLSQMHGYDTIRYQWRMALMARKLPVNKSSRYLYAQQLKKDVAPALGDYQTNWLIRDEMGIKSRNTLWLYLNE